MLDASAHPDEPTFAAFAHQWFAALADGRDEDAVAMLDEANSYGVRWPSAMVQKAVAAYGGQRVTHPNVTVGRSHQTLTPFDDGSGFAFDHDIPIDGSWSDLAAQFEFLWRDGRLAAVLQDIHVL